MTKRAYCRTPEESFAARTERIGDCLIWTGSRAGRGYGQIWVGGKMVYAHRYAWERVNGAVPDGMKVDHRDHCDLRCVEVKHLRLATYPENNANRKGPTSANRVGVRNVSLTRGGKYIVRVRKNGTQRYYGTFETVDEAETVAERARAELFGEFAGGS